MIIIGYWIMVVGVAFIAIVEVFDLIRRMIMRRKDDQRNDQLYSALNNMIETLNDLNNDYKCYIEDDQCEEKHEEPLKFGDED